MTPGVSGSDTPWWKLVVWRHPEWWSLALCVGAWMAMLVTAAPPDGSARHALHVRGSSFATEALARWLPMVAATMFPLLTRQVQFVAARSCWPRRNRAIALFLAGYTGVWLLYGLSVELLLALLGQSVWITTTCALLAVAWQFAPAKQFGIVQCHRTMPLAPSGLRADRDCLRFGWTIGGYCWLSCWALMLLGAGAEHALWATAAITGVVWMERTRLDPVRALRQGMLGRRIRLAR